MLNMVICYTVIEMDIVDSNKNFKDNRNSRCREQPHYLRAEMVADPRKRPLTATKPHTDPGPQSSREAERLLQYVTGITGKSVL